MPHEDANGLLERRSQKNKRQNVSLVGRTVTLASFTMARDEDTIEPVRCPILGTRAFACWLAQEMRWFRFRPSAVSLFSLYDERVRVNL